MTLPFCVEGLTQSIILCFPICSECHAYPPMSDQLIDPPTGQSNQNQSYVFGTNATYTCPCGFVRDGFAKRVVPSALRCFGVLGWHPQDLSPCVPGLLYKTDYYNVPVEYIMET